MDFSSFDLGKVKNMARKGIDRARQIAEGLNELELKVEEATNNDKWGPHGSLMSEITKRSYHGEEYKQILGILARRLHSEPNHWRHIYKSLLLLEYMAKNGPKKIVPELKSNGKVFTRLQKFEYIDSQGKDQGLNVRNRAKQLWDLVHDDDAIARERETAAKNRNKYSGYDRDTAAYAGRSSPAAASSLSAPTGTPAGEAFATVPKRKPGANGAAPAATGAAPAATGAAAVDPVAATEERISKLVVAEEVPAGGDGAPSSGTGGRARKKLSEISADTSIMGSIAAMAQKLPAPAASSSGPASASGAAADTGLNLLDFGDDDDDTPAAPEQPAPVPSEDPLAMLDELAAPPPAAPPAAAASGGADDWAPFAGAASAGVGDDDWAAFVSSPGAAAVRGAVVAPVAASGAGDWDAFAEPVAVAGGAGAGASAAFADPFAPAAPAAPAPAGGTGAGVRAPLPMDAFMTPAVEPIPAAPVATHPLQPLTAMGGASDSKAAVPEKDPFADLLG